MTERRMSQVMRQRNGFGKIFVQLERTGDIPRNGRDFHRMCQACAEMVAGAVKKDLRFIFEPAEGARMDDAVAVALVLCAPLGRWFLVFAPAGIGAELRIS